MATGFCWYHHQDTPGWTYYDGLPLDQAERLWTATQLAHTLSEYLDLPVGSCQFDQQFPQRHRHTCGTIALKHMAWCLGITSCLPFDTDMLFHAHLIQLAPLRASFTARGRDAPGDPLINLLSSKGVPEHAVTERAQMVRDKLGIAQTQQIMKSLKSAASKPGRMFRLVTPEEQKEYVNQRAQTKHGAKLSNVRQKKQTSLQRQAPTLIDPEHFNLNSQHFLDADGQPVHQIHFQDVGGQSRSSPVYYSDGQALLGTSTINQPPWTCSPLDRQSIVRHH